jgi:predicted alpha/beta-hydrolase family hydrolase
MAGISKADRRRQAVGRRPGRRRQTENWELRTAHSALTAEAAGGLLLREAGGRATSTEGDEESLSTGAIVVSNGLLHEQIMCVLRKGDAAPLPQ